MSGMPNLKPVIRQLLGCSPGGDFFKTQKTKAKARFFADAQNDSSLISYVTLSLSKCGIRFSVPQKLLTQSSPLRGTHEFLLKLTFTVFCFALLALPINVSATSNKTALNDALELALQSPGKVIDLAPYRDKSSAVAKMGEVSAKTRLKVDQSFGRMPLLFEKNESQTSDDVKFLSRGRGYNFYLTATESVMVLSKAVEENKSGKTVSEKNDGENVSGKLDPLNRLASIENPPKMERAVVRMEIIGANEKAVIKGEEKLNSTSNYFLGNDQSKWRQGVENFARVHYEDIYPGIDLVYYGNQRKLEYDFIVKPGANPNKIELNFSGADKLSLDGKGNLVLKTKVGDVIQHAPVIYQTINGEKQIVEGEYVLKANNRVAFHITSYNPEHSLVIDPVLGFSTYLGGSSSDWGVGIAVDNSGNVYVTGQTLSTDFSILNAFQSSLGDISGDVFVAKMDSSGSLVFSTYFGGTMFEFFPSRAPNQLATDNAGNVYIAGVTNSTDFPTLNAFQSSFGGGPDDVFVAKFSPSGSLLFSTYLGGNSSEVPSGLGIDNSGNVLVAGSSNPENASLPLGDFPTLNAFQSSFGGGFNDVFVTKFTPTGSLVFSTYLGGTGADSADINFNDGPRGLDIDDSGNIYVTGETASSNFPTFNAFQSSFGGGVSDIYITKFNASGSLIFSTYLGGADRESNRGFYVDGSGAIYTAGTTLSTDFPTLNAFQSSHGGDIWDAFLAKFDATGSLVFSTYFGGMSRDIGFGLDVDSWGNSFLLGHTESTNFPTLNAFQSSYGGGFWDAFVAKFDPTGFLVFSTYLGGARLDISGEIDVDSDGNVYLAGSTDSSNFPILNTFQSSFGGGFDDVFVAKFNPSGGLAFSTYLGGSDFDEISKMGVDNSGNVYVTGRTSSINFPTLNAFQSSHGGGQDAFVTKVKESPIHHSNDFDGDTQSDILAVHSSGLLVSALIENSVLQEFALLLQADPAQGWTVNATGDFNGDKKADLLLYNTTSGEYRTVLLDGTAVLSDTVVFTIDPSIGVEPHGVGDFDGDGEDEIIIYHPPSGFTALVYLTAGVFSSFEAITTIDVAGNWTLTDTGHFNGDNKTDLLITNSVTGEGAIIEMDGSNATGPTTIFFLDPVQGWTVINTGDFTGNGSSDILILHSTGALGVLTFDGLTFQTLYVPGGLLPDWQLINVGNYDGINKADFLIYDTVSGDLMTAVQDGTTITSYTPVLNLGPASGWTYHSGKP